MRLIPVTAVGHDFAVLQEGQVLKKPDGQFRPSNVDLPLSAVVPDILRQVELSLDRATREAIVAEAHRRTRMGPLEALQALSLFAAQTASRVLVSAVGAGIPGDAALTLFMDTQSLPGYDRDARIAQLDEADRRAERFVQARRRVVRELQNQVYVLEAKLPSSRLSGEDPA
jgi:hypothetical protein